MLEEKSNPEWVEKLSDMIKESKGKKAIKPSDKPNEKYNNS